MYITSTDNQKVKLYRKLNNKKYRDKYNLFIIEGFHNIYEAYDCNMLEELILLENINTNFEVPKLNVSKKVMDYIYKMPSTPKMLGICKILNKEELGNKIIMLDNVQDPGNLGTIIRSAAAFNFDTVVLSEDCVDVYNPKVLRACEGMVFNVNIVKTDLIPCIKKLLKEDYEVYATSVIRGENIANIDSSNKIACIMGNEGNGIRPEIFKLNLKKIFINMGKKCESLNVGVAGSILMYEVFNAANR